MSSFRWSLTKFICPSTKQHSTVPVKYWKRNRKWISASCYVLLSVMWECVLSRSTVWYMAGLLHGGGRAGKGIQTFDWTFGGRVLGILGHIWDNIRNVYFEQGACEGVNWVQLSVWPNVTVIAFRWCYTAVKNFLLQWTTSVWLINILCQTIRSLICYLYVFFVKDVLDIRLVL
jgi:hypothetical protein